MLTSQLIVYGILVFEIICLFIFFDVFFKRRHEKHRVLFVLIASICLSAVLFWAVRYLPARDNTMYSIMRLLIYSTLYFAILHSFYRGKVILKIIVAGLAYLLLYFVDAFGIVVVSLFGLGTAIGLHDIGGSTAIVMVIKIVLFFVVSLMRFAKSRYNKAVGNVGIDTIVNIKGWLIILFMPLVSMLSIWTIFGLAPEDNYNHPTLLVVSLCWVAMCAVVYSIVFHGARNDWIAKQLAIDNEKIRNSIEFAAANKRNIEAARSMFHDFKHHLAAVGGLLAEGKSERAMNYISTVDKELTVGMQRIDANDDIVNAILNEKLEVASNKDIGFSVQINDLSQLPFSDEDLVIIMSNLIDNAIEACEKLDKGRFINFKFVVLPSEEIILSIRNTYNGALFASAEKLLTSKEDKVSHGIGFSSAVDRIKKYSGEHAIDYDEHEFQFTAIIPRTA